MSFTLLDGKIISQRVREEVARQTEELKRSRNLQPGLAVLLVGEDPASKVYVRSKAKACQEVGFLSEEIRLPFQTQETELLDCIQKLNQRPDIHGILVQHPLPPHIQESLIYETILPEKDVDGFHPFNMGRLLLGIPQFVPCTPLGVIEILKRYQIPMEGRHVVVVGRSNIVGKPVAALFAQKDFGTNATVTLCHSGTKNLKAHLKMAEIIVAAIGKPQFIQAEAVREGVVVVDVGINRVSDPLSEKGYRLVGDVDFDGVSKKAAAITPVPGGIGLMTVAMLLKNTLKAAQMTIKNL
ncbi:MAG: bifunctional 5,10-methylenetetrahydrofolate dehydrogenase/5,10-methenyltetrahydrofolate cyclohydrolase [Chlamydiae bacterium]|nr:bifunctional 5,10-methylenetetrahydrofolate dehydrogenase/5,10-methenyltetrahydrofolate cyclohydrolase [Chlamydiota bacterium]